nr:uncharacterized protein LOC127296737 isoform X4 [Lolium perenne]
MSPERNRGDQRYSWFPYRLPNGEEILVYKDKDGVLFTDHGGPTRPVQDVIREFLSGLSRDPPPPTVDESGSKRPEEDQQGATPNPAPSPAQYTKEYQQVSESSITAASSFSLPQPTSLLKLKELLDTTAVDKSCITSVSPSLLQSLLSGVPDPLALKLGMALISSSFVSSLVPTGLFIKYFVRVDKEGFFHTYPDRGGPFKTLEKAQEAIDSHHVVQREMMCMDGLSDEERAVRNTLYWYHDGTRKHSAEAFASCTTRCTTRELLKALIDMHNEDNDLLGDHAYELKGIVGHNSCFDGKDCIYRSYSHFNLTMKTKGADHNNDLYFAEVTCMSGDYEAYVLTCICIVKPDHNGECAVCEDKKDDIKHPNDDVYNRGRRNKFHVIRSRRRSHALGVDLFEKLFAVREEAWLIEEEARVRRMIKEGKDARSSKLEVDRGEGMIKEGKEARRNLEVDKILKLASRKLRVDNILKEDNRGDVMIKEGKEARRSKLEVDNRRGDHAKRDKYVVPARRKSVERDLSRVCI